ncbi:MAG: hypothetical protein RLZZ127_2807 [Planctomycetota bacterium]|jgi:hypothetical protein
MRLTFRTAQAPLLATALLAAAACTATRSEGPVAGREPGAPARPATWVGSGTVFQYAVPVQRPDGKTVQAYLWVPPAAERIRGLVVGGTILSEGHIASHPEVRAACARAGLGIVLFTPHLDAVFNATASAPVLERTLADLAAVSGMPELAQAPLLPFGHSVGTIWTRNLLFWNPGRMIGGIFYKGGFGIPEGRALAELDGIPLLHVQGRFEEFGPASDGRLRPEQGEDRSTGGRTAMAQLSALRAERPDFLMGLLVEEGATHYALNEPVARVIAAYIEAAARLRLDPAGGTAPVVGARGVVVPGTDLFAPASATTGTGFWYPDTEVADRVAAMHRGAGREPQFVSAADAKGNPRKVAHDMRLPIQPDWTGPGEFRARAAFWTVVPDLYPGRGASAAHAATPPQVAIFGGPVEAVGEDRFRITMDVRLGDRIFLTAWHPGDERFRWAEQSMNIRTPAVLTKGASQAIAVALPQRLPRSALPMPLSATASSGLPVSWYVDHGPARVIDGRLELADLPQRATGTVPVRIVATQYGDAVAKIASATAAATILLDP